MAASSITPEPPKFSLFNFRFLPSCFCVSISVFLPSCFCFSLQSIMAASILALQFPFFYHIVSAFLYKASWQHQFSLFKFRFLSPCFCFSLQSIMAASILVLQFRFLSPCFCFSLQSIMAASILALQFPFFYHLVSAFLYKASWQH